MWNGPSITLLVHSWTGLKNEKKGGGKKRTLLLAKDSWFPVDDLLQIDTVFTSAVKYVPLSPNIHVYISAYTVLPCYCILAALHSIERNLFWQSFIKHHYCTDVLHNNAIQRHQMKFPLYDQSISLNELLIGVWESACPDPVLLHINRASRRYERTSSDEWRLEICLFSSCDVWSD